MRKIILAVVLVVFLPAIEAGFGNGFSQEAPKDTLPKTIGKVSHQYKKGGCATIIIVQNLPPAEPLVLIPKTPLPKKLDKEGMEIKFNYRKLRMPNPKGCEKGIPAELSDIQKK